MKRFITALLAASLIFTLAGCGGGAEQSNPLTARVCTAQEAYDAAVADESVVTFSGVELISGGGEWDDFYSRASAGKSASVLIANRYDLYPERMSPEAYEAEKDDYPKVYLTLLEYDGKSYTVQSRLSSDEQPEDSAEYKYLMHYTGDLPAQSEYSTYDRYVLVNDPELTWERIERGLYSSQLGDAVDHRSVYTHYIK